MALCLNTARNVQDLLMCLIKLTLLLAMASSPELATASERSEFIRIAVFDFELEDVMPASAYLGQTTSSDANLKEVNDEARRMLSASGRYNVVDVSGIDTRSVAHGPLRRCDGCEADLAQRLGATQSLLGVVTRVTQTDYYVTIQIRDARTGKLIDQQEANFAGSDDGRGSGFRILIKHQVLVDRT